MTTPMHTTSTPQQLTLDQLHPSPFNERHIQPGDVKDNLVLSIKELGIMQPLVARARAEGGYEIIAGERRYVAAKLAKLQTVPVYIVEADDTTAQQLRIAENLQRKDLPPLATADALLKLREKNGESLHNPSCWSGKLLPRSSWRRRW